MPTTPLAWRILPTRANGQLAFGAYRWDAKAGCHRAAVLDVVTLREDRVEAITAFWGYESLAAFGLPSALRAR